MQVIALIAQPQYTPSLKKRSASSHGRWTGMNGEIYYEKKKNEYIQDMKETVQIKTYP